MVSDSVLSYNLIHSAHCTAVLLLKDLQLEALRWMCTAYHVSKVCAQGACGLVVLHHTVVI